jgi:hypothetical protein
MAKAKSTRKAAKRPVKNLSTRARARKVTGGALLINTRGTSTCSGGGESQPPDTVTVRSR